MSYRATTMASADVARPVFYFPIRHQFENLGDVLIVRGVLDALREHGSVRVVAPDTPPSLVGLLALRPEEMAERSDWLKGLAGLSGRGRGRRVMVLKPGAVVNPRTGKERLKALTRLASLAGVRVLGAGGAQFGYSASGLRTPWRQIEMAKVRLLTVARPRDERTVADLRLAVPAAPDAIVLCRDVPPPGPATGRTRLVVSLRDGEGVDDGNIEALGRALRATADAAGLELTLVTQVRRDHPVNERIAAAAQADDLLVWDDDDVETRQPIYVAYQQAAAVVSNRLHVLLVAWRSGAPVVAVVGDEGSKIPGALASTTGDGGEVTTAAALLAGGLADAMAAASAAPGRPEAEARAELEGVIREGLAGLTRG